VLGSFTQHYKKLLRETQKYPKPSAWQQASGGLTSLATAYAIKLVTNAMCSVPAILYSHTFPVLAMVL
jgi:hypothetical protein